MEKCRGLNTGSKTLQQVLISATDGESICFTLKRLLLVESLLAFVSNDMNWCSKEMIEEMAHSSLYHINRLSPFVLF